MEARIWCLLRWSKVDVKIGRCASVVDCGVRYGGKGRPRFIYELPSADTLADALLSFFDLRVDLLTISVQRDPKQPRYQQELLWYEHLPVRSQTRARSDMQRPCMEGDKDTTPTGIT